MKARCLFAANGPNSVFNVSAIEYSLNGLTTGVSFPLSRRKYTSRLFIIPAIRPAASWMVCAWRIRLTVSVSFSSSSALPLMAASGVRSSWVTFWIRLRRNLINFSFVLLLSCNLAMSFSRRFLSWSLCFISLWMARLPLMVFVLHFPVDGEVRQEQQDDGGGYGDGEQPDGQCLRFGYLPFPMSEGGLCLRVEVADETVQFPVQCPVAVALRLRRLSA